MDAARSELVDPGANRCNEAASVVPETYSEVQQMDIVTSVAVADGPAAELTSKKLLGGA